MNFYSIIILAALVLEYALQVAADYLNISSLASTLPAEFEGVYDAQAYTKSQQYTKIRTSFGIVTSSFNLVVALVFWFAGGFNLLDEFVRSWNISPLWNGLLYIGILIILRSVISLPFNVYSTFIIEERFGFNKTTAKTFILDLLKSLLLTLVLGGPLLAGILAFFAFAGPLAWLYCWIVSTLFILVVQFIAPTWIMPLFNKFKPLDNGELKTAILDYAQSVKFPLKGIFVMDGSKRSTKTNAFFTGFGKNKRIALFDTLIAKHSVAELVAVLAHEIGHYKKKHIVRGIIISIMHMGAMFFLLSLFINSRELFDTFYMKEISVYAGLIFFGLLFTPIEMILSVVMNMFSRKHEYEADRFAADTIERPETMVEALKKLSVSNLSNLTPNPFYVFLNYSHPPVLNRIAAIRRIGTT